MQLRPLTREDFPLLARWLAEPVVARWWNQPFTLQAIEAEYGAAIDGAEPTDVFVAQEGGEPFGLIQRYRVHAYPEYAAELAPLLDVPEDALSVDYLVGEPRLRGAQRGARMIEAAIATHDGPVIVPVAAGNRASWRTLEHAGFRRVAEGPLKPDNPIDPPDHVVYRRG